MNVEPLNPPGPSNHSDHTASSIHIESSDYSNGASAPHRQSNPANQADVCTAVSDAHAEGQLEKLTQFLLGEFRTELPDSTASLDVVAQRLAAEVIRICLKSDRIQTSGQVQSWQLTLARHRQQKCLSYHRLGSRRGRVDLHSSLSAMVYRHVASTRMQLGFQARYNLIEDFLQSFYIEVMKAFRRENELPDTYTPKTRLELAEYMAFTEHYAKRRITLPGRRSQQLVVLRAQGFARRQPVETAMDIEMAMESAKTEEAEIQNRSPLAQQVREQMVTDAVDPSESVLRDRVVNELMQYLESQGQSDCVDYLTLKLQDVSVPEIDDILGLTARQRDYLQQRFKYHVEKFARSHRWQLVHQWLGADVDQNLGMPQQQWEIFLGQLSPEQQRLLELKGMQASDRPMAQRTDEEIAKALNCTPKQVQKRWVKLLELAWQFRNKS